MRKAYSGAAKSLMEEKQEGPEGKQTPGVSGAREPPPLLRSTRRCGPVLPGRSRPMKNRGITLCTVTCKPLKSIPREMSVFREARRENIIAT